MPIRSAVLITAILAAIAPPAAAQAPLAGPLVLQAAPSARTTALAGTWVAGRDQDVIFYNPAQLVGNVRADIDLSLIRFADGHTQKSIASGYAGGKWSLTLGWGVQLVDFDAATSAYPRSMDALVSENASTGTSALLAVGGAVTVKGFRAGVTGKYVSERITTPLLGFAPDVAHHRAVLADVGVARNQLGGVLAFSLQNIGGDDEDTGATIPLQYAYGYSMTRVAGPLDLSIFSQMTHRSGWASPGGGIEVGYTWIEGYTVVLRAGARRPERSVQKPYTLGLGVTGDRVTVEYAAQFFEGGHAAHGVTVRWR